MDARRPGPRGVAIDSGETPPLLRGREPSYTVPLRREGNGDDRRNAVWLPGVGKATTVEWKTDGTSRPVGTEAVVMRPAEEQEKGVY